MKSKIILLCILFVGIMSISANAIAAPAIINDIVIDTQDSSVKLTITSSQTLQIETFKNDESPANYIVLDFIGSVYTNMPSIIEVGQGAVEKVSLVRGEESQISIDGEPYYSLDFLAINLTSTADYRVNQSQSVIDLSIGVSGAEKTVKQEAKPYIAETAVELTPPIVVSRKQKTVEPVVSNDDYINYKAKYDDLPVAIETNSREIEPIQKEEVPVLEKRSRVRKEMKTKVDAIRSKSAKQKLKKKKSNRGFLFFRKRTVEDVPQEVVQEEKAPIVKKRVVAPVQVEKENYLIDSIVNETIREKQKTTDRIEDLTMELKNLQQSLSLSKGQKSELDEKINEILAKLDQLKNSLDDEIKRRQALGEKVDDLIGQRNAYIKAKKDYEDFQAQLNSVNASVDDLNTEVKEISSKIDLVRFEKRKLEDDVNLMETEYSQIKTEYDNTVKIKDSITLTVEKLSREIDELRQKLDKAMEAKTRVLADLKNFENANKFSGTELARLKQVLLDKNAVLTDLSKRYEQLKLNLDLAVSEKFKVEYAYKNAKTEYDRIKREIETYLQKQ
ncbi:MAG: hypothetical protein KJ915_06925 [Candidatus Omnitrophica bacterium]|nr:hypothetical protein [Candidatus Omnitrophota bacterium]